MNIWPRRLELKKETRQAAISRRRVTQSNLSWNWRQTINFLPWKIPAPDPLDMYPCPIRMRAQSFQNFSRKVILKLQDQLSQHDRCKNLNQRHLRYARRFKSTSQCIATIGSSKPQPWPTQMFVWSRYADWWIWINVRTSNGFGWDFYTGRVEKAGLATSGSLFLRNFVIFEVRN